jgi:hypothetical protein
MVDGAVWCVGWRNDVRWLKKWCVLVDGMMWCCGLLWLWSADAYVMGSAGTLCEDLELGLKNWERNMWVWVGVTNCLFVITWEREKRAMWVWVGNNNCLCERLCERGYWKGHMNYSGCDQLLVCDNVREKSAPCEFGWVITTACVWDCVKENIERAIWIIVGVTNCLYVMM